MSRSIEEADGVPRIGQNRSSKAMLNRSLNLPPKPVGREAEASGGGSIGLPSHVFVRISRVANASDHKAPKDVHYYGSFVF